MKAGIRSCFGPKTVVVNEDQLRAVPLAQKTDSYTPIGHDEFSKRVTDKLVAKGMVIKQQVHALWRNGLRYFGLMEVTHPRISSDIMSLAVAVRNSMDKSLPAAIAAGNSVFVCDNLVLAGEVVVGRRHTSRMFEDLDQRIDHALNVLEAYWEDHFQRVNTYRGRDLSQTEAHDLIVRAYQAGVVEKVGVADVIDQYHRPNHPEFKDRNLWSLHNAFSEIFKGRADLIGARSDALHKLFDQIADYAPAAVKRVLADSLENERNAAGRKAHARPA